MQEESISLYYKDARSDKVYHAQLQAAGDGFVVNFQYGRRGGTLAAGTKTAEPVDHAKAKKAFDAIVKEKVSKGYSPGAAGAAFTHTSLEERFTGVVPQLLNPIDEDEAQAFLADADWVLQEKHDGHRRLVRANADELVGVNRKGLAVPLPENVAAAFEGLRASLAPLVDGELMGDTFAIFDILEAGGQDLRPRSYRERLAALDELRARLGDARGVYVTRTAFTEADKRALYAELAASGKEGGVYKRLDAPYVPGRPNSGGNQVKRKFTHSATFIVADGRATRRSVGLELIDEAGGRAKLGNVTIPSNQEIPAPGTLLEVEYLYAYRGGALAQPQCKGPRDDIETAACTTAQLHYKAEGGEDDADA